MNDPRLSDIPKPDFIFMETYQSANDAMRLGFAGLVKGPQQFADAWMRLGQEWLMFVSRRLSAQAELMGRLRECTDVQQVATTEARFLEAAAEQYSQEFDRLSEVAHEAARDATTPKRKRGAPQAA